MTGPLIDRAALFKAIDGELPGNTPVIALINATDAVLAYLREVLTPEALDVSVRYPDRDLPQFLIGAALERRIFGEER